MSEVDVVLRYAFSQGPGRDFVAPPEPVERPVTSTFGTFPKAFATDRVCRLVWGTVDLLEDTAYPGPCAIETQSTEDRVQHSLVMAFGLQRREPSNMFNDHRGCASVRSKFPVHVFLHTDNEAWLLDPYRRGLLPVADACPTFPTGGALHVALAGRYTHLPSPYGRLRGPLTELELGISLRSLWVALEIFGLTAELRLPGADAQQLMDHLGLDRVGQWSVPLVVALDPQPPTTTAGEPVTDGPDDDDDAGDDPTLDEVVAVNRMSLRAVAEQVASWRGGARAIPRGISADATSWGQVTWQRSAGRMPRGMAGFSGRRRRVAATAVTDAVAWLALPPPTPLLEQIAAQITVTACLQDAEGFATGQYRLVREGDGTATAQLVRADPQLPSRLEACYGHGVGVTVGCAVHQANMVWLFSVDVAALVTTVGPGGWTLAQYACGWMAHGLCLSAAAHGLYARPNRAFDDIALQPVVGIEPGEMLLLSVVAGVSRFVEPILDLRS